jgi:hypothetical protein
VVLQHIIDDELLRSYVEQFYDATTKNSRLLIVENVSDNEDLPYMKFRSINEYVKLFDKFSVYGEKTFSWGKQTHAILYFERD